MTILEILKQALSIDTADYSNMPDYSTMLDHMGLTPDDDPDFIRECIEMEVQDMEANGESAEGEAEGDAGEE